MDSVNFRYQNRMLRLPAQFVPFRVGDYPKRNINVTLQGIHRSIYGTLNYGERSYWGTLLGEEVNLPLPEDFTSELVSLYQNYRNSDISLVRDTLGEAYYDVSFTVFYSAQVVFDVNYGEFPDIIDHPELVPEDQTDRMEDIAYRA